MAPPKGDRNIKITSYIGDAPAEEDVFSYTSVKDSFLLITVPAILDDALVYTDGNGLIWHSVEDFDASKPGDRHFVLDCASGELKLGDGMNGDISSGKRLVAAVYYSTLAEKGNISAGTVNQIIDYSGASKDLTVTNFENSIGGREAESLEAALLRAQLDLKKTYKAVTLRDFEEIALCTPGLRIARAQASWSKELGNSNEAVKIIVIPYRLPNSSCKREPSSEGFKQTVCLHLDKHRLLTTPIEVVDAKYIEVSVQTVLRAKPLASIEGVQNRVNSALNKLFDPLVGFDGLGWPFGKTIYKSMICSVLEDVDGVDCVQSLTIIAQGRVSVKSNGPNLEIPQDYTTVPGHHVIEVIQSQESQENQGGSCK
jgi:predicted phage baseplate assembly protein